MRRRAGAAIARQSTAAPPPHVPSGDASEHVNRGLEENTARPSNGPRPGPLLRAAIGCRAPVGARSSGVPPPPTYEITTEKRSRRVGLSSERERERGGERAGSAEEGRGRVEPAIESIATDDSPDGADGPPPGRHACAPPSRPRLCLVLLVLWPVARCAARKNGAQEEKAGHAEQVRDGQARPKPRARGRPRPSTTTCPIMSCTAGRS